MTEDECTGKCYLCVRLSQIDLRDQASVMGALLEVLELIREHKLGCSGCENTRTA